MRHAEDNDDTNQEGMFPLSEYDVVTNFKVSGKDYGKRDVMLTVFKTSEVKNVGYGEYSYLYGYRTRNAGSNASFTSDGYDDYMLCLQTALLNIYRKFYEDKQEHNPSSQE